MYNINEKMPMSQIHLKSGFKSYAQRYNKIPYFLRRKGNYKVWWTLLNSPILSKTQTETVTTETCKVSAKPSTVLQFRPDYFYPLLYNCWDISYRQYSFIAIQWCIQETSWCKNISQSNNNKTFPAQTPSKSYSPNYQSTRPATREIIFYWLSADQYDIRFRSNCNYCIWQTNTKSKTWLRPQEARKKMLLSHTMLRKQSPRILVWNFTIREHQRNNISQRFHQKVQNKIVKTNKKNSYQSRCRFLRWQICEILRRRRNNLHYRSTEIWCDAKYNPFAQISTIQRWLGNIKIHISTIPLGKTTLVYCKTSSGTRKTRRLDSIRIKFNSNQGIPLPSFSDKSHNKTQTCLELSPPESSWCRTEYQRTKMELSINKNSNSKLYSEYCLSSTAIICFQYCQLVQATLSTQRVAVQNITNYSPRFYINSSKTDQVWRQKYTKVSYCLPGPKAFLSCGEKDPESENLKILSKFKNVVPTKQ